MAFPHPAALGAALVFTLACSSKQPGGAGNTADPAADDTTRNGTLALPVSGEAVRKGDLVLTVSGTGQIESEATSTLKAQTDGTVEAVLVRPGDHVGRGQLLVRLDSIPLMLDLRAAEAGVTTAQVNYRNIIDPDSAGTGKAPTEARRQYATAASGLATAQIALDRAQLALAHATVTAPYDGVIETVAVAVGDHVASGGDIATVVDVTNLRVEAQVLEHDLPLIRTGGDAYVTVAAMPDKPVRGSIAAVLPLVDTVTRAGRALIRLTGDGVLRPGMYVDVRLEATRLPNRIIVPTRAIIERDSRPLVFVVKDNRAEWVYVNVGRSNGRETEILADSATGTIPLVPGDIVLTDGQQTLSHHAPIRLINRSAGDHL